MANADVAFYYPGWIWRDAGWLKNLLLFFDGVALLVPEYMRERPEAADPAIVTGLQEHGLLTILEPERLVDQTAAEVLASQLADLLASGALDELADPGQPMAELSLSRMGYTGDTGLARMLLEELEERGLAAPTRDGVSVPLHPLVRNLVLVLLAQILRARGHDQGLDLSPATDVPRVHEALGRLLALPSQPSAGHVLRLDFEAVAVDLSSVGIDEILEFRETHGVEHRAYARELRNLVRTLGSLSPEDRDEALRDRRETLTDAGRELAGHGRSWWRRPASVALGISGAAWTAATGDPLGALLAAGGAGLAALPRAETVDAHSYLFGAKALTAA